MLFTLAKKSLLNRKTTALLTVFSIAISVFVLLGIEHMRTQTKSNFTRTLSDTDLVVGARTGDINLLLYSVFRMGSATNNISWHSYQRIKNNPYVKWTIPMSLGDSHKGYRVLGTSKAYFTRYKYGNKSSLAFAQGNKFNTLYDVVLGAQVAKKLGYTIGKKIVLAHGVSQHSFSMHDDKPFTVVGILKPTGTPVDNTLHVSLQAIEAIHVGWQGGVKTKTNALITEQDLTPKNITAFLVGLQSKMVTFSFQRMINQYPSEALMAILPGATLAKFWGMLLSVENVLFIISVLVLISAFIGMATMLLSSLRERNRELSILRAIGATPLFSLILIQLEVLLLTTAGIVLAVIVLAITLLFGQSTLLNNYGIFVSLNFITLQTIVMLIGIVCMALLVGCIPAMFAYRQSLAQGLQAK